MINSLRVKNLKSIQDSGKVEIKPITILIGPNSSGKTSFIQFLLVIKQTLESGTNENPILINGQYVELGTFKDLIFGHNETKNLEFEFYIPTSNFIKEIDTFLNRAESVSKDNYFDMLVNLYRESKQEKSIDLTSDFHRLEDFPWLNLQNKAENDINKILKYLSKLSEYDPQIKQKLKSLDYRKSLISEIPKIKKDMEDMDFSLLKLSVQISFEKLGKKMVLSEYAVSDANNKSILKIKDKKIYFSTKDKPSKNTALGKPDFFFEIIQQEKNYRSPTWDYNGQLLNLFNVYVIKNIDEFFQGLYYLGPLREYPKRYYLASGEISQDVGLKGEFFVDVLYRTKLEKQITILNSLNVWMKKFNMAYEIKLEEVTENIYALVVVDPYSKTPVTITDVGFGVSQVLPILVEGFHLKAGSTIIVEQPEIHLHPKVQAELGDLLIEFYEQEKFSIIETHSEHLILRIQRRIAEGKIKNSDVGIYYFEPTENGSKIIAMEIDESGMIKNWPKGFFEEDFVESYKHIEAIIEKSKKEGSL